MVRGTAPPAFFTHTGGKWQSDQQANPKDRCGEERGNLHPGWQIGEDRVDPQEEEVRLP